MNATMALYNKKDQLRLEKDVFSVSLKASLLQVMDGMLFPRDKAPNNVALRSMAL